MGSVKHEASCGHIYLQKDVSGEFERSMQATTHTSPDLFLEHLLELFIKSEAETKVVKVRTDLAQKFTSVQCKTPFRSNEDLMRHLLNLHVEHQKSATNVSTPPQEKRMSGRKSRKSQPKKNYQHTAFLDSDEESGGPLPNNVSSKSWKGISISSMDDTVDISAQDTSDANATFDLSRVKQEADDNMAAVKQNEKDSHAIREPVGLHKPLSTNNGTNKLGFQSPGCEAVGKTLRQFTTPDWRHHSEPVDHDLCRRPKHEPSSLQTSPQEYIKEEKEAMKNGYNYVLTLTDNSQGRNAMQVPLMFPKSTVHHVSSDEDEPEDLSRVPCTVKHQPENMSVFKNGLPNKGSNDVKYDRNANAVPLSQLQNNQFVAQTQIPIPHNLLFHDPRSVTHVGPPPMLQMKPMPSTMEQNAPHLGLGLQTSVTHSVIMHGHTLLMAQQNVPPSPTGALFMRSGLMSPNSGTRILVPIAPLISPGGGGDHPQPNTPNLSSSEDNQTQDSPETARKKRKKMEDTTVFRDPPEQSLPFNGPNKYRFYCDVCDTGFTRRYTFNRHKCKGRVEKHYCQLCDKAYLSKYKLKDHILVKHEGQTVSCPECGKRFSSRSSMEMHKKQQHEGQYSIFCKICGKGFNHTGHYYGHMNKHTNTKPFWCQQCGKRFYGSSYLHNHKQVCRGNNDMNFACSVCDRKFKCELYLKKHMKIHDNTPIISNPDVVKATDEDLANAGVNLAEMDDSQSLDSMNGERFCLGQPIFPNGPDQSDSNSSFMDDDGPLVKEGNNNHESQPVVAT